MKNNKGITLIALVITIVILIILASVGITALIENDGIFGNAKQAKELTYQKKLEEKVKLKQLEYDLTSEKLGEDISLYDFFMEAKDSGEFDEVIDDGKGNLIIMLYGHSVTIAKEKEIDIGILTEAGIYNKKLNLIESWETAKEKGQLKVENGVLVECNITIDNPIIFLGNDVTTISDELFSGTNLFGLILSDSVETFNSNICSNCSNLKYLRVSEGNSTYNSEENIVWKNNWIIIGANNSKINNKDFDIYISDYAFSGRNLHYGLDLSKAVYFGSYSFYNTNGEKFTNNQLGNADGTSLVIDSYAFSKSSVIPEQLTLIYAKASNMVNGVTKPGLGNNSFEECNSLKELYINSNVRLA